MEHQFNDEYRRFVSSRQLWKMPAPVWTMIIWAVVELLNLGLALALTPNISALDTGALVAGCIYMAGLIVALLIMRGRTPIWFLHSQVIGIILITCMLVTTSASHLDMVNSSFALLGVTMYSSYWFKRRMAIIYIVAGAAAYFVAIWISGELSDLFLSWFTLSTACIAIGATFSTVVTHLYSQAVTDNLTGLLNRAGLQMLIDLQGLAGRAGAPRTVIVIDLDGFKELNDKQGHLAGDDMLKAVSRAWLVEKRADDVIVRTGGDEFLFILKDTTKEESEALIARLKSSSPCEWSYGTAQWGPGETFDEALKAADKVLYEDKARKKKPKIAPPAREATASGR